MQHCSCSLCSPSLTKSWKFAIFVHCSESTSRCYVKHCTTLYVRQVCTTAAACKEAINRHIYTPHIHTVYSSIVSNISTCRRWSMTMNRPKHVLFLSVTMQSTSPLQSLVVGKKGRSGQLQTGRQRKLFAIHRRTHSRKMSRRDRGTEN